MKLDAIHLLIGLLITTILCGLKCGNRFSLKYLQLYEAPQDENPQACSPKVSHLTVFDSSSCLPIIPALLDLALTETHTTHWDNMTSSWPHPTKVRQCDVFRGGRSSSGNEAI